ncbi:MAG: indolepyruvate ferredoxin oxidoreductase subunit alpha [Bacillota bacterium]|nr:indolepyruvate ferredoxin oxidoreductase subunit alpha [Bacillota bacterium]
MVKKNLSGNEAVAQAALAAGAKIICGYPGTPSSEVIGSIWQKDIPGVTVEWSTNEKVALEIAAAGAWAGQRTLCTMKMSGLNVAYDSLISVVYSGCTGGMVLYVCDDPGVAAGMPEQDVRGFAQMSDIPVLEPCSVQESYQMIKYAFELSEQVGGVVMVRSVTSVSQSHAIIDVPEEPPFSAREPQLIRDIHKYTKAGAKICMDQHADLLARLDAAQDIITRDKLNILELGQKDGLGIISVGVVNTYVKEALELAAAHGIKTGGYSWLQVKNSNPLPEHEIRQMLEHCSKVVVLEENEPYVERGVYLTAYQLGKLLPITGKLNEVLSKINSYDAVTVLKGITAALGVAMPAELAEPYTEAEALCAARPIGVCAGCPHRGVYIALNNAVKKLGYKKDDVMITGDIGCTILGMSPPFHTLWTEVAMGASVAMAQGFVHAGVKTPVFSTMGDSTFMHAGMPPLLNAVQQNVNMTAIIMDNGWTAMTGMQVNANTASEFQQNETKVRVDVERIIRGLGVEQLFICDPYDLPKLTETLVEAAKLPGVKVVLTRRECAIQAGRRKIKYGTMHVDTDKCINCKICINTTGCPALVWDGEKVFIDQAQCNGCGICTSICPKDAIVKEGK